MIWNRQRLPLVLAIILLWLSALLGLGGIIASQWVAGRLQPPVATATLGPTMTPMVTATPTVTPVPSPSSTVTATATAEPTPTPRPPRPITKIGPEIYAGTHVELGRPPVIKLRNTSKEHVAEVRQLVGPECLIIIRFEFDEPNTGGEPRNEARAWHARRRADMLAMKGAGGHNIAFETAVNECPEDLLDWYVQFSLELIPLMHADGLRCVAGNPAVGNWSVAGWAKFRPVLKALRPTDFLGVHEYWVDTPGIANRWHCARWSIPEIAAILGNVKIVVTEAGRDQVEGRGQPGWKRTTNAEDYIYEIEEYDLLLRRFPNVVGATIFTIDPNWPDFDVYDIWPQVVFRYSLTPTPPTR